MRGGALRLLPAWAALVVLVLAGAAVTWLWLWARGSVQDLGGNIRVAGLENAVTVHLDRFAIPHVLALTETDAFRAQGFLHASERLFQMELLRRTAQGRLSELFGERALEVDRVARTLDLWGVADRGLAALPPPERRLLNAYADGVNERLRSWSGPLPPEYLILGIEPEPWDARSSVAIGKLLALDLSGWRWELARWRASQLLPPEKYEYLELPYPEWGPAIVEREDEPPVPDPPEVGVPGGGASGIDRDVETRRAARLTEARSARSARPGRIRREDLAPPGPERWDPFAVLSAHALVSSNAWVLAGVRSWSGQPLLSNDMHMSLRAPSIWFLNALHAVGEGLHVAGLSIPGVPGVVVGYNRQVAWGFTNGMVDDADFVVEAPNLDGSAYRDGERWVEFVVRPETIQVRGRAPEVQHVRETVRGPVVSDALPDFGVPLSLLWTGRAPTTEFVGLLAMNRARSAREFDEAVRRFRSPHQNVMYATTRGSIGYRLSGTVPRREFDGSRPVSFEEVGGGWAGFWSPDEHPSASDPARGYLASANNLQSRDLEDDLVADYPLPFRARRIVDRLEGELAWTVDLTGRLQLDARNLMADRVLPRAVAAATRIEEGEVAERLSTWDRDASLDSPEATLFHSWLYRLRAYIAADEFEGHEEAAYFPDAALLKILEDGGGPWVDDVRTDTTETLEGLEELAMRDALALWGGRAWGEVHHERSVHPLGESVWLDRLFGFNLGPTPVAGGPHSVRPDDPLRWAPLDSTSWTPPYVGQYGPSQRFIAELRPGGSLGWFILPGGQSGNPFSPHYRSMKGPWNAGELIPLPVYLEEARARAVRTLQLLPT